MKCNTYHEVYSEYQEIASQTLEGKSDLEILRTDCYNESGISSIPKTIVPFILPHCSLLQIFEIDPNVIKEAKKKDYMNNKKVFIKEQNIITFNENERKYDVIFDFSTIDHMEFEEAIIVLKKYKYALKEKGILSLVVWLNEFEHKHMPIDKQYYFKRDLFDKAIKKNFHISKQEHLFSDHNSELWYYKLSLKKMTLWKKLLLFLKLMKT
ncbi:MULTISPECIES: hypothetical protein [unclassified Lentimicrobium]|uniref:hypothetical protein n=1 Tax=unclassified Lentimicrobium TaxID=2677434 RepID=UPI001558085F|nr:MULTISPECIES: hypothetical protein [unclassified Lentimicrobium]NPD45568.1 hypothetical protein [Lentimicrobium sp. S6]NPD83647.1 hypothetical protein [Lentimicrobium sp. L6]